MSKPTQKIAFSAEIQTELFSLKICFDMYSQNFANVFRDEKLDVLVVKNVNKMLTILTWDILPGIPLVMFQVNINVWYVWFLRVTNLVEENFLIFADLSITYSLVKEMNLDLTYP